MIAIIPARGGSKGLPGKNIKPLNGKPLIAYTIEEALKTKNITRVIVSTDDSEIAEVAKKYGAEIPFMRPKSLADDTAKSIDVYNYTIKRLEEEENSEINEVIILQPTSPLRTSQHIDEAIELYFTKKADSVVSYCQEEHPVFWHKYINEEGKFEDIFEEDYLKNRQEIRPTYFPNGAIYILKKEMLSKGTYYSDKSYAYIMDSQFSVDIDTETEFNFVQFLMQV